MYFRTGCLSLNGTWVYSILITWNPVHVSQYLSYLAQHWVFWRVEFVAGNEKKKLLTNWQNLQKIQCAVFARPDEHDNWWSRCQKNVTLSVGREEWPYTVQMIGITRPLNLTWPQTVLRNVTRLQSFWTAYLAAIGKCLRFSNMSKCKAF